MRGIFCIPLLFCSTASAATLLYTVTALPFSPSVINSSGQIVGTALPVKGASYQKLFFYSDGVTSNVVLPDASAVELSGLNDNGQAVGEETVNGVEHPIEFSAGSMTDLSKNLGASTLASINDNGQMVGDTSRGTAFSATAGVMTTLGTAASGKTVSGINQNGQIVGSELLPVTYSSACQSGGGGNRAFVYSGGAVQVIGPDSACGSSSGIAVNSKGQVLGQFNDKGSTSVFIYNMNSGATTTLPTLGGNLNNAYSFNSKGQVAGSANLCSDPHQKCYNTYVATLYSQGVMTNLNDLMPAGSGWILESATGINDKGEIIGYGIYDGGLEGFLLTPEDPPTAPEPKTTWGLLLAGCCGAVILRRKLGTTPSDGSRR